MNIATDRQIITMKQIYNLKNSFRLGNTTITQNIYSTLRGKRIMYTFMLENSMVKLRLLHKVLKTFVLMIS